MLEVQSNMLHALDTTVVILLERHNPATFLPVLNVLIEIANTSYILVTQEITKLQQKELGSPFANISSKRSDITSALDRLSIAC